MNKLKPEVEMAIKVRANSWMEKYSNPGDFEEYGQQEAMWAGATPWAEQCDKLEDALLNLYSDPYSVKCIRDADRALYSYQQFLKISKESIDLKPKVLEGFGGNGVMEIEETLK